MILPMLLVACLTALAVGLWLPGWRFHQQPRDALSKAKPALDIRRHLNGPLISEGVIYGPLGRVNARFVAHMQGDWDHNSGVLRETFHYASGGSDDREWRMEIRPDGKITATAHDIVGTANGMQIGAGLRMTYRIRLARSEGGHCLSVTDWMYVMENGTIMNHSQMRKFGIKVAELIAVIRPAPAPEQAP